MLLQVGPCLSGAPRELARALTQSLAAPAVLELSPNLLCLPQVLGHTEWIKDCPNPKFKTLIECEYFFEKKQVPTASKVPHSAPLTQQGLMR